MDVEVFKRSLGRFKRKVEIYFVSEYPPFEFCLHNVRAADDAQCYMRHRNPRKNVKKNKKIVWIQWCETAKEANAFALELDRIRIEDDHGWRMFRDTSFCRIHLKDKPLSLNSLTTLGVGLFGGSSTQR